MHHHLNGIQIMATKSKVAQIKDLKQGVTVYRVYALDIYSFIRSHFLTGKPHKVDASILGVDLSNLVVDFGHKKYDYFYLSDAGMTTQPYNQHKTFTTLRAAKRYQEYCIKFGIGVYRPYENIIY